MRKLLIFCFLAVAISQIGSSNIPFYKEENLFYNKPVSYREYAIDKLFKVGIPNEITLTVLDVCIEENVDFFDVLSILLIENSTFNIRATNTNYKQVYSRRLKRNVRQIASKDEGLFQLNSEYLEYFIWKYWKEEDGKFDIYNYIHNTKVAVRLYKDLLRIFNGQKYYAVMAYNAGAGRVANKEVPVSTSSTYINLFYTYRSKLVN
jgi:hypothetical protein